MRVTLTHAETLCLLLYILALFQCSRLGNSCFAMCLFAYYHFGLISPIDGYHVGLISPIDGLSVWHYWSKCAFIYFIRSCNARRRCNAPDPGPARMIRDARSWRSGMRQEVRPRNGPVMSPPDNPFHIPIRINDLARISIHSTYQSG